jgi:hypothetical protein
MKERSGASRQAFLIDGAGPSNPPRQKHSRSGGPRLLATGGGQWSFYLARIPYSALSRLLKMPICVFGALGHSLRRTGSTPHLALCAPPSIWTCYSLTTAYFGFSPKGPTAIVTLVVPVQLSVILMVAVFSGFEKLRCASFPLKEFTNVHPSFAILYIKKSIND